MAEKFLRATVDYLTFTFGAMLLAAACFSIYGIFTSGNSGLHLSAAILMAIFSAKMLTALRAGAAGEPSVIDVRTLSTVDRLLVNIAAVFISSGLLFRLIANLSSHHARAEK